MDQDAQEVPVHPGLRRRDKFVTGGSFRPRGAFVSRAGIFHGNRLVPIPGTTKLHRLEENIAAAEVALTPSDMDDIERAAAEIPVEGDRYPPELLAMTGR